MSRAAASIAAILALLTGLVLGQLGSLASRSSSFASSAPSSSSPRALASARTFYDDLNHLLATGDRTVDSTVATGFVEHPPDGQASRTLPEMIDWLLALRATWPQMRMTVVSLEQHDPVIVVRLQVDPGTPQPIPGVPLESIASGQVTEFLRFEGSGIVDRWESGANVPVATLSQQIDIDWKSPSLIMPAIERIELEPGRELQLPLDGPAILRVETGSVQLDQAGNDLNGTRHPRDEPIDAGGVRVLEPAEPVTARNDSTEPADLWIFNTNAKTMATPGDDATAEPESARIYAFIPLQLSSYLRGNLQHISIARLVLPPGAGVPVHEAGVMEEIAVLDGTIEVTVGSGRALACTDGVAHPFDDTVTIGTGQGVSAKGTAALGYRATGSLPATLLIMRVDSPVEPGTPTPAT